MKLLDQIILFDDEFSPPNKPKYYTQTHTHADNWEGKILKVYILFPTFVDFCYISLEQKVWTYI